MLNNFEMICTKIEGNNDITIYPIADVHLGAAEHLRGEWEKFCANVKNEPNARIVLAGDLIDNATKNSIASPWDNVLRPSEQKKIMTKMLEPLRDQILCIIPGNHCGRNRDVDDDPTYDIACKLDIENLYRPDMAFVKLQLGNAEASGLRNPTYTFCVAHGNGSSIYVGASAAKGERFGMAVDGIDLMITGHTHKPADVPNAKIYVDKNNNKVSIKPWRYVVCSSWLGYASYAARKLLPPTATVSQKIILHGREKAIEVVQLTR